MAYRSVYIPTQPGKCINVRIGQTVQTRSLWERQLAKWCDTSNAVKEWGLETVIIPYICGTDNKKHKYIMDFYIEFTNGKKILVEVKPAHKTKEPLKRSRITWRWQKELLDYVKNMSKWKYADAYAKSRGMLFEIWSEKDLQALGLKVL